MCKLHEAGDLVMSQKRNQLFCKRCTASVSSLDEQESGNKQLESNRFLLHNSNYMIIVLVVSELQDRHRLHSTRRLVPRHLRIPVTLTLLTH